MRYISHCTYSLNTNYKIGTSTMLYSGSSVADHNSFEFVDRKPICSKTETFFLIIFETFFPIKNNGKYFYPFYPKKNI